MEISVIIPAYNEARRLPRLLDQFVDFRPKFGRELEVIVVDDGSTDGTARTAESYKAKLPGLRVLRLPKNSGKGYAVKQGLLKAAGGIRLYMDADGSVEPDEISKKIHFIEQDGFDMVVGSRVLKDKSQILKTRWHRRTLGAFFHLLTRTLLLKEIRDTQCGFKMFRAEIVEPLFSKNRIHGYGFDMEILYLAVRAGYRIKEVPVSWKHVRGSKVHLLTDSLRLIINIFQIKKWHRGG